AAPLDRSASYREPTARAREDLAALAPGCSAQRLSMPGGIRSGVSSSSRQGRRDLPTARARSATLPRAVQADRAARVRVEAAAGLRPTIEAPAVTRAQAKP